MGATKGAARLCRCVGTPPGAAPGAALRLLPASRRTLRRRRQHLNSRPCAHPPIPHPGLPLRSIPPLPRPVPVRPIFLDTALTFIQAPDLSHRLPKKTAAEAQGTFSRLFGGWR